jgi:hypothetical protein
MTEQIDYCGNCGHVRYNHRPDCDYRPHMGIGEAKCSCKKFVQAEEE